MGNIKHVAVVLGISILIVAGLAVYAGQKNAPSAPPPGGEDAEALTSPLTPEEQEIANPEITNTMNPTAELNTSMGTIEIELFEDTMPITVGNFVSLAESGFYDGIKFHRVIDGFMIQGGDPNTKGDNTATYGQGGPENNVQDEFVEGPLLTNVRGTIAMANTGQPNSGGSQFFINLADNTSLDFDKQPLSSKHPVFGRVVAGIDVVDTIGKVETDGRDLPTTPVVIESVTIKRGG